MVTASFDSTKKSLYELLTRARDGLLQLPDFQRDWIWDEERIRSLLASVSVSFPIGAIMLLQTGSDQIRFKPRPLAGTSPSLTDISPEVLVLDGQQRLTSLYLALMSPHPVETKDAKGKHVRRWFYFDMKKALANDDDREEAVLIIPEDRKVKTFSGEVRVDVSSREKEFAAHLFPANHIFQSADWRRDYSKYWGYDPEKSKLFDDFEREVIKRFEQYQVPVIELKRETPKEAVCLVFERVNTGGVALTVFDLLTASFAAENYQLREDWKSREKRLKSKHRVLENLQSDDFLQAVTLLATYKKHRQAPKSSVPADDAPGISCKRKEILKLTVADWQTWADRAEDGFAQAARFLHTQKIFTARDLPYRTQLVPLAAILVELGQLWENEGARQKLARWYWCGVLGELYGSTLETRFARDLPEVVAWVRGEPQEPTTVREAHFAASRLLSLRTRNSAAYKGIYALLMREGCRDFRTGEPIEVQTFFGDSIDIHHIFPEKWCRDANIKPEQFNSIVNKTALSASTNRQIGGRAPSVYLPLLEEKCGITSSRMDEILRSHCIQPPFLRADLFDEFFNARTEALILLVEKAMGKEVVRDQPFFDTEPISSSVDEEEAWDGNSLPTEDAV